MRSGRVSYSVLQFFLVNLAVCSRAFLVFCCSTLICAAKTAEAQKLQSDLTDRKNQHNRVPERLGEVTKFGATLDSQMKRARRKLEKARRIREDADRDLVQAMGTIIA